MREQRGHLSAEELRELNEFTVEDERVPSPEQIESNDTIVLPEIQTMSGYIRQHYEANIVEEAARKLRNGDLCVRHENKIYRTCPWLGPADYDGEEVEAILEVASTPGDYAQFADIIPLDGEITWMDFRRAGVSFVDANLILTMRIELDIQGTKVEVSERYAIDMWFDMEDGIVGEIGNIRLHYRSAEHSGVKLDEYLIPVLSLNDIEEEAERIILNKAQVTVAYENGVPAYVDTVVISVQHSAEVDRKSIKRFIGSAVIGKVIPPKYLRKETCILINPSGCFIQGGPAADTGLTGRKLAVDQYGPVARIGGGALSGKDATKVDRSGAYAARWVAKNIVAAGLAKRCEVQIAYAIGKCEPVSIMVDTFGTGLISDRRIEAAVKESFDLTPAGIIHALHLDKPIYAELACYGHFGRLDLCSPWELTNCKHELLLAALKQEKK